MAVGVERVVVGHTIQEPGGITAACGGRVLRVDVGMSAGCADAKPEVLEIVNGGEAMHKLRLEGDVVTRTAITGVPTQPSARNARATAFGLGIPSLRL